MCLSKTSKTRWSNLLGEDPVGPWHWDCAPRTAAECLELPGCRGTGTANHFAEIAAAMVLAGDLSLMAAFCSHEFVEAHESLGRNRPSGS